MTHELVLLKRTVSVLRRREAEVGLSGDERARLDIALTQLEVSTKIQNEVEAGYQPVAA